MSRFLNERIEKIDAYVPGEQPKDKQYIKLNTNESPFPPSPSAIASINNAVISDLRLYCDPECKLLRAELASLYRVGEKNIFLSNGSDDILNFAFMAYGKNGAAFADITYGFYSVFAELHGVESDIIPLKKDFSLDADAFIGKSKLIVIANPNAPTGIETPITEIERIISENSDSIVLIDEAYVDFGAESAVSLTAKYENLICVCTFSKSRSMAGARLGFAIANEKLIADLEKIKYSTNPYNINSMTQIIGTATVKDNDYYMENCKKIIKNREYTVAELEKMKFNVIDSKANFIFAQSNDISGKDLYLKLKDKGVLVRHFDKPRISNYNRITIGSLEEMKVFLEKVQEILNEVNQ